MKLSECQPGRSVVIGARYLRLGYGLTEATVIETRSEPASPGENPAYPNGMVRVRLDPAVWPDSEPWIGPEDLALPLGGPTTDEERTSP